MNTRTKIMLLVVSLLLAALPVLSVKAFNTESEAIVLVYPSESTVKVNATFQVFINVSANKLQGFDFMLNYDNRLLNCLNVSEGTFLSAFGPTFVAKGEINNSFTQTCGRVWVAAVIYGTGFADGNGTLAVITFKALSTGQTTLHLYSDFPLRQSMVKLTTCGSQAIPNKTVDGSVTIVAMSDDLNDPPPTSGADPPPSVPSADVNGDGVVNVEDLALVAAAYGSVRGGVQYRVGADLDQDGIVDVRDLAMVAHAFLRMM
jgi:hypothetical protein